MAESILNMSWKGRIGGFLLVLLLVFLLLTAYANYARYARKVAYLAMLEPPARYSHPYRGPVIEHVTSSAEVRTLCVVSRDDSSPGFACAWVDKGTCYLVLPSDGPAPVDVYRRHETAHCNGWTQNHPQD
ncbi:MAG TPA: hypothetical protein VKE53_00570 [Pseudolabrys sp.]|nr:hypothetical protein [Pseudolabrys sp.]